jgi:hypothetical protein
MGDQLGLLDRAACASGPYARRPHITEVGKRADQVHGKTESHRRTLWTVRRY